MLGEAHYVRYDETSAHSLASLFDPAAVGVGLDEPAGVAGHLLVRLFAFLLGMHSIK
jgi:hypothetical protein